MKQLLLILLFSSSLFGANECIVCHDGIEHIRDESSGMNKAILKVAEKAGHKGNDCIVCHGGNPYNKSIEYAHQGTVDYFKTTVGPKDFYSAPASKWINKNTCGMCHPEQVKAQNNSLMSSEQGKIQGALWSFGGKNGYNHDIGNYKGKNPTDLHSRLGTPTYSKYMQSLQAKEPQVFTKNMQALPKAPTAEEVEKNPSLAVYTYLRQECLKCHTGSEGSKSRGDFRGTGCASCHIPYSNEGYYEGNDKSIKKRARGHLLVHTIQATRDAKVKVHNQEYSGVPVESCATCHNSGKSIGVSYQGLMQSDFSSTYDSKGNKQDKLHNKRYMHMQSDIHFQKGMLCQDCHTSNDMHGDGFLSGSSIASVEIECQDCHGTTSKYPWELPLGYSDEFSKDKLTTAPRKTVKTVAEYLKKGSINEPDDGYLLSARGNPLVHATKVGNEILIRLASGKDITLKPLKKLKADKKLSKEALLAMDTISSHTDNMECYSCHAQWTPQSYGHFVKIDYSEGKQAPDYLSASQFHYRDGKTDESRNLKKHLIDGVVTQDGGYLRWEEPTLVQNGEGRVSPSAPIYQTTITVIGKDKKALLQNHIFKIKNVEGAGGEGQNAIDMTPLQPHTISKESRSCESCHSSKKAMGMGINGSNINPTLSTITDIMSADGKLMPTKINEQVGVIKNLVNDYSKIFDDRGNQIQSVGHHLKLSQPLSKAQLDKLDRSGLCLSCHKDIPKGNLAISAMAHLAEVANLEIDNKMHKTIVNKTLNVTAWVQIFGAGFMLFVFIISFYIIFIRKKPINPRNRGWK